MGWFSSLFSSGSSHRRGQVLSATHDAFSLAASTPASAVSSSYTYPPQGPSPYGYMPTFAASSRPTSSSLLPTHLDPLHTPLSPSTPYPPLESTWNRLRAWLDREYPELGDTLNYGILPEDLAQLEMQFGFALPAVVRESYLCVDGQEAESSAGCSDGLFFGLTLLPLEDVYEEWRFWREVDEDPSTGANPSLKQVMQSIPANWIRCEYSQRGWIPLVADKVGNYIGVDLNPADSGSVGQVIVFGRDFDTKVVLWQGDGPTGWAKWLASFVDDLESGEGYEIGRGEVSDDSEDDLGYESYFYDGNGRGQGDGGGDNGTGGGLRLTGGYRGWNVLDAWADRSLRKWHEAGVIAETSFIARDDGKGKERNTVGLGVMDQTSGTEVAIPVLTDVDEPIPPPAVTSALENVTNKVTRLPPRELPMISITKPPAPLPVELPTPRDIMSTPSPPPLDTTLDEGFELGQRQGMTQVYNDDAGVISPRRAHKGQASSSTDPLTSGINIDSSSKIATVPDSVPDLLTNSAPALDTVPLQPLTVSAQDNVADGVTNSTTNDNTSENDSMDQDTDPDTTIRLVGGGGTGEASEMLVTEKEHDFSGKKGAETRTDEQHAEKRF
ncbi:hypothetical protein AX17_001882 [Amanita inopinata Kibby_2008]|nr:hypothetical protein AX17_001882 [Amanita inopinata Kibby_2008]